MTWWLVGAEVILVMTAFGACCGGLIHTYCASQRRSRCVKTSICWGCLKCDRDVESDELMIAEAQAEGGKVAPPRERSASVDEPVPPASGQI